MIDAGAGGRIFTRPRALEIDQTPSRLLVANRRRVGAYVFNAGGKLELPLDLGAGDRAGTALPLQQFIDSGSIAVPAYALSSYKLLTLYVDNQLTKGAASQATLQLLVGRDRWAPANGNASQVGSNFFNQVKGAVVNIGGNAASLGPGIFVLSPADVADLQWPHPYVGVELNAGGTPTGGSARAFITMPGGPAVLLGFDQQISGRTGPTANSMLLPPLSPWQWIPTARELWAMATPGGTADVRVWEVFYPEPKHAADGSEQP